MEPDYSNYSVEELEDALTSIDRVAYPERTEKLKRELLNRQNCTVTRQAGISLPYRWSSIGRSVFFIIFFSAIALLSYSSFLDKNLEAIIPFIISVTCIILYAIVLYQKSGWVQVDENGVTYQNLFGQKQVLWHDISGCYIRYIKITKIVYLVSKNGGNITLPIVGWKAKEIHNTVNYEIQRREA